MDERLAPILRDVGRDALAKVVADALGVASVTNPGDPIYEEINAIHADTRTIGIVRISGSAPGLNGGRERPWSTVAKIIDMSVPPLWKETVDPENEVRVYEHELFATTERGFRPARCYHISRPSQGLTVLWLEDLTSAKGPPFSVSELAEMARHIGEWNALTAARPPRLAFAVGRDFQVRCWKEWNFPARLAQLRTMDDDRTARAMYAHYTVDLAAEFVAVFGEIIERSKTLPHALALADCPVGNFFHLPGATIGIDWAGLGDEPIGADGGRFIGSALTWGRRFPEIAKHERDLFESYAAGLFTRGHGGARDAVRTAYLSELGYYLGVIAMLPTSLSGTLNVLPREFFERRYGWPIDQLGEIAASVIDLLPSYIAEARILLAQ